MDGWMDGRTDGWMDSLLIITLHLRGWIILQLNKISLKYYYLLEAYLHRKLI